MPHSRIVVAPTTELAWGLLVKTWITGKNYVRHKATEDNPRPDAPDSKNEFPRPKTFYEFVDQCEKAIVDLRYFDNNAPVQKTDPLGLIMLQTDSDVVIIRLSPTDILASSEDILIDNTQPYVMPDYYKNVFENHLLKPTAVDTKVHRMELHARRVGEYTIAMCF